MSCLWCRGPVAWSRDGRGSLVPDRYCGPECRRKDRPRAQTAIQEAKVRNQKIDQWMDREWRHLKEIQRWYRGDKDFEDDGRADDIRERLERVKNRDLRLLPPKGDLDKALWEQGGKHHFNLFCLEMEADEAAREQSDDEEEEEEKEVDGWVQVKSRK
jgi:hypothetical protein